MDSKKFFQELRKIIREEVNLAIKQQLSEQVNTTPQFNKDMEHARKLQEEIKRAPVKENPTLQDLLLETQESMKTVSLTSKDVPGFNRNTMAVMLGYGEAPVRGSSPVPATDIEGRPVHAVDETVEKALTRNYSDLMKAIKSKKK